MTTDDWLVVTYNHQLKHGVRAALLGFSSYSWILIRRRGSNFSWCADWYVMDSKELAYFGAKIETTAEF